MVCFIQTCSLESPPLWFLFVDLPWLLGAHFLFAHCLRTHFSLYTCSPFLLAYSVFLCVYAVFAVPFPWCLFCSCVVCLPVFRLSSLCSLPLPAYSVCLSVSPLALPPGLWWPRRSLPDGTAWTILQNCDLIKFLWFIIYSVSGLQF